jgi:hypothetical protein
MEQIDVTTAPQMKNAVQDDFLSDIEAVLKSEEMQSNLQNAPAAQKLYTIPENAREAKDETGIWAAVDDISTSISDAGKRSYSGIVRGYVQHKLGHAGAADRKYTTPETQAQIEAFNVQIEALGDRRDEGFISLLEASAEVLGQQGAIWGQWRAVERVGAGVGVGAGLGLAGGPFAPVTSAAGAATGGAVAGTTHLLYDAYVSAGGNSYLEMRNMGIDRDMAGGLSHGVGIMTAALEGVGAFGITKPISEAGKSVMRKAIGDAVMAPGVRKLLVKAGAQYGTSMVAEIGTEITEELVQIAAEEIGKQFSDGEFEAITPEEMAQRVGEVANHTMKAMVLLAMPGPGMYVAVNLQDAKQAGTSARELNLIKEKMGDSKLSDEKKSQFVSAILRDKQVDEVYIPGDMIREWLDAAEDPHSLATALGIEEQLDMAVDFEQDITVKGEQFAQHILLSERYDDIKDHIRITEYGMTKADSDEYIASGLKPDIERLLEDVPGLEVDKDDTLTFTEQQLGLKALFETGKEMGMTPKQVEAYYQKIDETGQERAKHMEDLVLKQEQKENTAEWKKAKAEVEANVSEQYSQMPTYASINSIGLERLNKEQLVEVADELGISLKDLPKVQGRAIYETDAKVASTDLELHAELHNYPDVESFVTDIATAVPMQEAISQEVSRQMEAKHGTLLSERNRLIEARRAVQSTATVDVLAMEMNALRIATGQKKLKPSVMRTAARERLKVDKAGEVNPAKYEKAAAKSGKAAAKALKAGNRHTAAEWKFKQAVNMEMARQSYDLRASQAKKADKMKGLTEEGGSRKIGFNALDDIRQVLSNVRLAKTKGETKRLNPELTEIPAKFNDPDNVIKWQDLSVEEFQDLYDLVQELAHKGRQAEKLFDEGTKRDLARIRQLMLDQIDRTIAKKSGRDLRTEQSQLSEVIDIGKGLASFVYNADTILREIDGFEDFGIAYTSIKGRYDRAMGHGYREDQDGYLVRKQKENQRITEIYDKHFTLKEQKRFGKKLKLPGVEKAVNQHTLIAILLNSGNKQNLYALEESGTYTQTELKLIREAATKKDWAFAQDILDYFDSFWSEVMDAEMRRKGVRPKKVLAQPIKHKYGTFKGGYYPIRYKSDDSVFFQEEDMQKLADGVKYGKFVNSMTDSGHTKTRTESKVKNPLDLNLFTINSHVDQVIYDLEMGDALNDAYKVLYDHDIEQAFINSGNKHLHKQLDLWFRDVVKGDVGASTEIERLIHHARTGVTVSKLGWNMGVAALQPLGILHTMVHVGKADTLRGLGQYLRHPVATTRFASEMSGFMKERASSYQTDINESRKALAKSWVNNALPGKMGQYIQDSYFFFIRIMQSFVDNITWTAAYGQGIREFDGDREKAILHGDRAVARSQASGILGERTPLERGTTGKNVQQKEIVKMFMNFMSYFMTKANLAAEQTKKTNFRNPVEVTNFVINMAVLFSVEAVAAALIRNEWDEEEPFWEQVAKLTGGTALSSIPGGNLMGAELQGYRGGSSFTATAREFAQAGVQISQAEWDEGLFNNVLDAVGIWYKLPTGQVKKTIGAFTKAEEEDVHWSEFLLGPKREN